jgi:hypothetical protein
MFASFTRNFHVFWYYVNQDNNGGIWSLIDPTPFNTVANSLHVLSHLQPSLCIFTLPFLFSLFIYFIYFCFCLSPFLGSPLSLIYAKFYFHFTLLSPVSTLFTTRLKLQKLYILPKEVFLCFVWIQNIEGECFCSALILWFLQQGRDVFNARCEMGL